MELTQEQIAQVYACKTPEDLMALAKANGVELDEEEAQVLLSDYAEGALADEELENVSGGDGCPERISYKVLEWDNRWQVPFLFNIGDEVQAFVSKHGGRHTATVRIVERDVFRTESNTYVDQYKVVKLSGCGKFDWEYRDRFEARG